MNRQEKQVVIDSLKNDFLTNQGSFLIGYQGMTVAQLQTLRKSLRSKGGKMLVANTRLMRLASENIPGASDLLPYFKNQIALVFADKEAPAVAQILLETSQKNKKLSVLAGCVESRVFDNEGVKVVATIPSRELLLTKVAYTLNAPVSQFATLLNHLIVRLLLVSKAIAEKKSNV